MTYYTRKLVMVDTTHFDTKAEGFRAPFRTKLIIRSKRENYLLGTTVHVNTAIEESEEITLKVNQDAYGYY